MMIQLNSNGYVPSAKTMAIEQLPDYLQCMLERMAENVHEAWAYQKMSEGWTFGKANDRLRKKHPSLRPYAQLDESQKDFDRSTALAILGFLMSEGYVVTK